MTEPSAEKTRGNVVGRPFAPGNKGKPRGAVSKTTKAIKEAVILAAEKVGSNGKGSGGLVGYLANLAKTEPVAFAGLLGKVLPLQIVGSGPNGEHVIARVERIIIDAEQTKQG